MTIQEIMKRIKLPEEAQCVAVSYTHLDVYKRQGIQVQRMPFIRIWNTWNRSIQIMY